MQKQQFLVAKDASLPPPFLLAWFGSLWFLHVSRNELTSTMASFSGFPWNSGTIADRPARRYQETVPAVFETLDLLLKTRESTTICNKGKSVFLYRVRLGSSGYASLSLCLEPTPRDVRGIARHTKSTSFRYCHGTSGECSVVVEFPAYWYIPTTAMLWDHNHASRCIWPSSYHIRNKTLSECKC